jgi:hypothetical protein
MVYTPPASIKTESGSNNDSGSNNSNNSPPSPQPTSTAPVKITTRAGRTVKKPVMFGEWEMGTPPGLQQDTPEDPESHQSRIKTYEQSVDETSTLRDKTVFYSTPKHEQISGNTLNRSSQSAFHGFPSTIDTNNDSTMKDQTDENLKSKSKRSDHLSETILNPNSPQAGLPNQPSFVHSTPLHHPQPRVPQPGTDLADKAQRRSQQILENQDIRANERAWEEVDAPTVLSPQRPPKLVNPNQSVQNQTQDFPDFDFTQLASSWGPSLIPPGPCLPNPSPRRPDPDPLQQPNLQQPVPRMSKKKDEQQPPGLRRSARERKKPQKYGYDD